MSDNQLCSCFHRQCIECLTSRQCCDLIKPSQYGECCHIFQGDRKPSHFLLCCLWGIRRNRQLGQESTCWHIFSLAKSIFLIVRIWYVDICGHGQSYIRNHKIVCIYAYIYTHNYIYIEISVALHGITSQQLQTTQKSCSYWLKKVIFLGILRVTTRLRILNGGRLRLVVVGVVYCHPHSHWHLQGKYSENLGIWYWHNIYILYNNYTLIIRNIL